MYGNSFFQSEPESLPESLPRMKLTLLDSQETKFRKKKSIERVFPAKQDRDSSFGSTESRRSS